MIKRNHYDYIYKSKDKGDIYAAEAAALEGKHGSRATLLQWITLLQHLSWRQLTADWFLLRKFLMTGRTALSILRQVAQHHLELTEDFKRLLKMLGIRLGHEEAAEDEDAAFDMEQKHYADEKYLIRNT